MIFMQAPFSFSNVHPFGAGVILQLALIAATLIMFLIISFIFFNAVRMFFMEAWIKIKKHRINFRFFCASVQEILFCPIKYYCVNDILTCKPALVLTIGALDEI